MSSLSPDLVLFRASEAHNLPMISHSLALGANKNWHNPNDNGRSPLHQAVASVSILIFLTDVLWNAFEIVTKFMSRKLFTLNDIMTGTGNCCQGSVMALQHLLINGARVNEQDEDGRTPLHLASLKSNIGQVKYYFAFPR